MTSEQPKATLERFFSGIAENTFQTQLGVADPPLVDYLSNLLIRFVRSDSLHSVRSVTGRPITEIGAMIAEATQRLGDARREIHRHIGDFTLFWAGLYPEALRQGAPETERDPYSDYCVHGKRAYQIASRMDAPDDESPTSDVLQRLSDRFELCAYGLREVRREWERQDDDPDTPRPILLN